MQKHLTALLLALPLCACKTPQEPCTLLLPYTEPNTQFSAAFSEPGVAVPFDLYLKETPKSVVTDFQNNLYVSLALTSEITRIDEKGVRTHLAWLPGGDLATCSDPFPVILGDLAIEPVTRDLYVPVNSCNDSSKGIYRVTQAGVVTMVGHFPPQVSGNGIALRLGRVYMSDSSSGRIFRTKMDGTQLEAEVWVEEPLLIDPNPSDVLHGASGIQFFDTKMWVANTGAKTLVTIDLELPFDGGGDIRPGAAQVMFGPLGSGATWEQHDFQGCDDLSFDAIGGIYCTTNLFQSVMHLNNYTGVVKTVFTAENGLDGPSSTAFGRGLNSRTLYISNTRFPFYHSTGHGPSVLQTTVPVGGYSLR